MSNILKYQNPSSPLLHQKGKYGFGDWTRQQPYEFIGTKDQRKAWCKDYNNLKNKKQ